MIYVYAVVEPSGAPLPVRGGLDGATLEEVRAGGVAAVFSRCDAPPPPDADVLWRHEQVVEALLTDRALLPLRFGTTLADEEALRGLLAERSAEWRRALDRVRGRVELSVRVAGEPGEPGEPLDAARGESGTDFMRRRLRARDERERLAAAIHAPLASLAERSAKSSAPSAGSALAGSYLVPRADVERFADEVRRLQSRHPALAVTCTGPWPPYSFVAEDAA